MKSLIKLQFKFKNSLRTYLIPPFPLYLLGRELPGVFKWKVFNLFSSCCFWWTVLALAQAPPAWPHHCLTISAGHWVKLTWPLWVCPHLWTRSSIFCTSRIWEEEMKWWDMKVLSKGKNKALGLWSLRFRIQKSNLRVPKYQGGMREVQSSGCAGRCRVVLGWPRPHPP